MQTTARAIEARPRRAEAPGSRARRVGRRGRKACLALATLALPSCGARNDLPGIDASPTPVADGTIFFGQTTTAESTSIVSIRNMDGADYATYADGLGLSRVCVHALDSNGFVLFSDGATRVLRLDVAEGRVDEAPFPGSLASAYDVAVDGEDRIFIADAEGNRIIRYDRFQDGDGFAFGASGSGVGELQGPRGVAVRDDGAIVIADTDNGRIVQVDDLAGNGWREWRLPGETSAPWDVALDDAGRIYVADHGGDSLWRIDDISGAGAVQVNLPDQPIGHVHVADDGRIYFTAELDTPAIFSLRGIESTEIFAFYGSDDAPLLETCGVAVR